MTFHNCRTGNSISAEREKERERERERELRETFRSTRCMSNSSARKVSSYIFLLGTLPSPGKGIASARKVRARVRVRATHEANRSHVDVVEVVLLPTTSEILRRYATIRR